MKKVLLLFIILFAVKVSFAQTPGSPDLTFGNSGIVITNMDTFSITGNAMELSNSKIIVGGYSSHGSSTDEDFVIIKYNSDGTLDNTFGTGGKVRTPISSYSDRALAMAVQTDGKIILAGNTTSYSPTTISFTIVRYNINGTLDNTFGTSGVVITSMGAGSMSNAYSVAIQNNGKIIVAGCSRINSTAYNDFTLCRYNVNGILDNTFGTNGIVKTTISSSSYFDRINGIAIQSDGKIICAGTTDNGSNKDFAIVRYDSTGILDNTFGTSGKVITPIGSIAAYANSIIIQTNGKILVAGINTNGTNSYFAMVRYSIYGTLDNTFGTSGIVTTSLNSQIDEAYSISLQNNRKILVAGSSTSGSNYNFGVVRYDTTGTLDNTFGVGGIVTTPIGSYGYSIAKSVKVQPDGNIILAGYSYDGTHQDFAVVRYYGDITTSIQQNNFENEFTIFPNPATTQLTIETIQKAEIEILNIQGQLMKNISSAFNKITIDISSFPSGMYFVKIKTEKETAVKKFIKE